MKHVGPSERTLDAASVIFGSRLHIAHRYAELLVAAGFSVESMLGVFHGGRLVDLDARHGGSIIDAQIARALAGAPWPDDLLADVASVATEDFDLIDAADRDVDDSLDLVAIAVRP